MMSSTVDELASIKSTKTTSTENGLIVVTNQLDDGSKSLRVVNGGLESHSREAVTNASVAANPNATDQPDR